MTDNLINRQSFTRTDQSNDTTHDTHLSSEAISLRLCGVPLHHQRLPLVLFFLNSQPKEDAVFEEHPSVKIPRASSNLKLRWTNPSGTIWNHVWKMNNPAFHRKWGEELTNRQVLHITKNSGLPTIKVGWRHFSRKGVLSLS